jgi:hypothetical protein
MVLGPMIALLTAGCSMTNRTASSIKLIPDFSASTARSSAACSFRWFSVLDMSYRCGVTPAASRSGWVPTSLGCWP